MRIEHWISLGAAAIVAIGWFVTGYLNRRKDVAQKRMEYRLKALESFLPVWFAIQKNSAPFSHPSFLLLLEDARAKIQLYGQNNEIALMEAFIAGLEKHDLGAANQALSELLSVVRTGIRRELGLGS